MNTLIFDSLPKRSRLAAGCCVAAIGLLPCNLVAAAESGPGDPVPGRYIVSVKSGHAPSGVAAFHGVAADAVFTRAGNGFAGLVPPGQLARLQGDPRVSSIVPDRVVTAIGKAAGPRRGPGGGGGGNKGGGGGATPQAEELPSGVARIGAPHATYKGAGIGIAIVDTGVDLDHADLRVGVRSYKAVLGKGFSIVSEDSTRAGDDDQGHGTHVGGTAAALDNEIDVVGVAPQATLHAVKVLDQRGRGTDTTVIMGLEWIATNHDKVTPPIKVVNMSLGRSGTLNDSPDYRNAIRSLVDLGITVVVAAGNDSSVEVSQQVPATYPEVIAVGSTTAVTGTSDISLNIAADSASYFTTDGAFNTITGIGVTISAPGEKQENIASGFLSSVGILSTANGGGTTRLSGTSMASPHVAGAVALLYNKKAAITPAAVRLALMAGADRIGSAPVDSLSQAYTYDGEKEGILDVPGALGAVSN